MSAATRHGMTPQARIQAQRKQQELNKKREEHRKALGIKLDKWFEAFDSNNDGELNRDELRVLLTDLHPDNPPDEKMLDHLIERATAIESSSLTLAGRVDGTVGRASAMKTVERYDSYVRQKTKLDEIFGKHDVDQSGLLEKEEVLAMMNEIIKKTPSLSHITADETDVDWVIERCDSDDDKKVSREELMSALSLWKELAQKKDAEEDALAAEQSKKAAQAKSSACVLL